MKKIGMVLIVLGGWASFCGASKPDGMEGEASITPAGARRASSGETSSAQSLPARPSGGGPCAAESPRYI